MKKLLIFALFFLAFNFSKADQLEWLTFEQAEKAVKELRSEKSVILWCACCDNEEKKLVTITNVYMEEIKNGEGYYYVIIDGVTSDGETITGKSLDLAYVHVRKNKSKNIFECLGEKLGFDCDPCTEPFSYKKN